MQRQKGLLITTFILIAVLYSIAIIHLKNPPEQDYEPVEIHLFEEPADGGEPGSVQQPEEMNKDLNIICD